MSRIMRKLGLGDDNFVNEFAAQTCPCAYGAGGSVNYNLRPQRNFVAEKRGRPAEFRRPAFFGQALAFFVHPGCQREARVSIIRA